jgi:GTPase SAR1 family protein
MKVFSLKKHRRKKSYTLIVLGDSNVGKTALCKKFVKEIFFEQYDPTIKEFYTKMIDIDEDEQIAYKIIDTAGSVRY